MAFAEMTLQSNGRPVYINIDKIESVMHGDRGAEVWVNVGDENSYYAVRESYEEAKKIINLRQQGGK